MQRITTYNTTYNITYNTTYMQCKSQNYTLCIIYGFQNLWQNLSVLSVLRGYYKYNWMPYVQIIFKIMLQYSLNSLDHFYLFFMVMLCTSTFLDSSLCSLHINFFLSHQLASLLFLFATAFVTQLFISISTLYLTFGFRLCINERK